MKIKNLIDYAYRRLFISTDFVEQPTAKSLGVSDLFLWRHDGKWRTYFELLDVFGLINNELNNSKNRYVIADFFDKNGKSFREEKIWLSDDTRTTLRINEFVEKQIDDKSENQKFGTFSIFHSIEGDFETGAILTDRGYCGYEFNNSSFRGYVHGNYDAIEKHPMGFKMLIGFNRISRFYNLQHVLKGPSSYDVAIVNPTFKSQKFKIFAAGNFKNTTTTCLIKPRGVEIISFELVKNEILSIRIKSKLYMARPLIFRTTDMSMDVFHG